LQLRYNSDLKIKKRMNIFFCSHQSAEMTLAYRHYYTNSPLREMFSVEI